MTLSPPLLPLRLPLATLRLLWSLCASLGSAPAHRSVRADYAIALQMQCKRTFCKKCREIIEDALVAWMLVQNPARAGKDYREPEG